MAGDGRFLVKWIPKTHDKGKSGAYDNHCISWIRHEDFLFPVLARRYLSREVNSNVCIQAWIEDCKERERCLNCMNTFDTSQNLFCPIICKACWSINAIKIRNNDVMRDTLSDPKFIVDFISAIYWPLTLT